jgi:hypothetical protein
MVSVSRMRRFGVVLVTLLAAGGPGLAPADAATITTGALVHGTKLDLSSASRCGTSGSLSTNLGTFSGSGRPGSGGSVCGDRSSVQVKDGSVPNLFGRHAIDDDLAWIDSNDLEKVTWDVDIGKAFRELSFIVVDPNDQKASFFDILVNGQSWSLTDRQADRSVHLIRIAFGEAVDRATIEFRTRHNDGYGLLGMRVAPVPLAPALIPALTALALLAGVGYRRR